MTEYETKTKWMKDLNTVGGTDNYATYISPWSENSSANSIQGKNLTLGNTPWSFEPRNLDPIAASNTYGGCYGPRWSLEYGNCNCIPGYDSQQRYDFRNSPSNLIAESVAKENWIRKNKKEKYEIPGLVGSNITCETFCGCDPNRRKKIWCIIIGIIVGIILIGLIWGFSCRCRNGSVSGGVITHRNSGDSYIF